MIPQASLLLKSNLIAEKDQTLTLPSDKLTIAPKETTTQQPNSVEQSTKWQFTVYLGMCVVLEPTQINHGLSIDKKFLQT